jgi:hypothetical protein
VTELETRFRAESTPLLSPLSALSDARTMSQVEEQEFEGDDSLVQGPMLVHKLQARGYMTVGGDEKT